MGIVTGITPQKKDKNRCNIYIDNVYCCGLELETIIKYKIKTGELLDSEELALMQLESEKTKATERAAGYISRSMKTEKELYDYLAGKGYGEAVISHITEKFRTYGYIDDCAYAVSYINTYGNKKGAKLLKYELARRGVSAKDIDAAFELTEPDSGAAKTLAAKFMKSRDNSRDTLSKLYRHLAAKGFSYDEIDEAIDEYRED